MRRIEKLGLFEVADGAVRIVGFEYHHPEDLLVIPKACARYGANLRMPCETRLASGQE